VIYRDITYRDASVSDARELADLARVTFTQTFGPNYSPADLERFFELNFTEALIRSELESPGVEVRVALAGRRMMAYCKLCPVRLPVEAGPEPALELHRIYVSQERQGIGVGRILLTWAIDRARQRGAKNLFLGVWTANARAIALYESRGFETVGAYTFEVGDTRDEDQIMRLTLP
jgi:diamine N-acetyltransferase